MILKDNVIYLFDMLSSSYHIKFLEMYFDFFHHLLAFAESHMCPVFVADAIS